MRYQINCQVVLINDETLQDDILPPVTFDAVLDRVSNYINDDLQLSFSEIAEMTIVLVPVEETEEIATEPVAEPEPEFSETFEQESETTSSDD